MFYCDSNLFIYPVIYSDGKAKSAIKVLYSLGKGRIQGITCSLTVDEVFWIIHKKTNREIAIEEAKRMFKFPNLKVVDTKALDVERSIELIERYELKPRDAIHAACSLNHGIFSIISDDKDFDIIDEIERLSFRDVVTKEKL